MDSLVKLDIPEASILNKWRKDDLVTALANVSKLLKETRSNSTTPELSSNIDFQLLDGVASEGVEPPDVGLDGAEQTLPTKQLSDKMDNIKRLLDTVISQNTLLTNMVTAQKLTIDDLSEKQIETSATVSTVTHDVKKLMAHLDIDESESDAYEPQDPVVAKDFLMLGDSLVRDIENTSNELTVTNLGLAKLCNIKKELKTIKPQKNKYQTISLVCGSNDVATSMANERIVQEFSDVLKLAKERADEVTLSSVLPRLDEKVCPKKIDALNQLLLTLCNSLEVTFINNDMNFKFRDGTTDESLFQQCDKFHLSYLGTKKLLQNLKLLDHAKPRTRKSAMEQQIHEVWSAPFHEPVSPQPPPNMDEPNIVKFRGANSPFSNFFPTSIATWGKNFKSVEHGYTYYKALTMNKTKEAEDILKARHAKAAKDIGDKIDTNQKWQNVKDGVMFHLLQMKAQQCDFFSEELRNTRDAILVENTDNEYWGRGKLGTGKNTLGRMLMALRKHLVSPKGAWQDSSRWTREYDTPTDPYGYRHGQQDRGSYTPKPRVSPRKWTNGRNRPSNIDEQQHCFNCGEISHTVATCRHQRRIKCYQCHKEGHKRKFCQSSSRQHQTEWSGLK